MLKKTLVAIFLLLPLFTFGQSIFKWSQGGTNSAGPYASSTVIMSTGSEFIGMATSTLGLPTFSDLFNSNYWTDTGTALHPATTTRSLGIGTSTVDSTMTIRKADMFDSVWCYYSGVATDRTSVANTTAGTAFNVGSAVGEYTWIGKNTTFSEIYINVSTAGSDIAYTWEYSKGGGVWGTLSVTESTTGVSKWRADGSLTFTPPVDWVTDTVNGYTGYIVRASPISAVTTRPTAITIVPSSVGVLSVYANAGDTTAMFRINEQGNIGVNVTPSNSYRLYLSGNTYFSGIHTQSGALTQANSSQGVLRTTGISTNAGTASTLAVPVQYSPLFLQRGRVWETGTTTDVAYVQSTSTVGQETAPTKVWFSPDGLNMYVMGSTGDDINQYSLSVAWDISTASYVRVYAVGNGETLPRGLYMKNDGLKFWVVGNTNDTIYQHSMASAWDLSTASYDSVSFAVGTEEATPNAVFFRPDGKQMYVMGDTGDDVNIYNLSTAWDVSTAVYSTVFSVSGQESGPMGLYFSPDGYKMYVIGTTGDDVNVYRLGVAWDVTTAVYRIIYSVSAEATPRGIFWRADGLKFYEIGASLQTVREYNVVVPWELNTVPVDTYAGYYSQVKPASGNPITALREDGFYYGGSEYRPYWNWLSDGKVGFGTSTPDRTLSIVGDMRVGTEDEYLTVSTRDIYGGGAFTVPLLSFNNANSLAQDERIGAIDLGVVLSDDQAGTPLLVMAGATINEPYAIMQYSTSTQILTLNTDTASTSQEYFMFGKQEIMGNYYPLIHGVGNDGGSNGLAIKDTLVISGDSPILAFYDEDDVAYNLMQMSADGLLSLGGISASREATSTDTGLKEAFTGSGALLARNAQGEKTCTVYKDSYNDTGAFARTSAMGAVCGINSEIGETDWVGGITIEAFSTSTIDSNPITKAFFRPIETDFYAGTTSDRYWKITEADFSGSALGDMGKYPLLSGVSDGFFGNIGLIADTVTLYDTIDDDVTSLNFAGNNLSSIGSLEYDSQKHTFNFVEVLGDANVSVEGNLGIGTTTPLARLDVAGTLGSTADLFNISSTTATSITSLFKVAYDGLCTIFNLKIAGGFSTAYQNVSTDITASSTTNTLFATSTVNIVITLPSASTVDGQEIKIFQDSATSSADIICSGGCLVNNSATSTLSGRGNSVLVKAMNGNWWAN